MPNDTTPASSDQPARAPHTSPKKGRRGRSAAVQFFLRGLAISLPPILTLVIIIWIGNGVNNYIILPVRSSVQWTISQFIDESRPIDELVEWQKLPSLDYCNRNYLITPEYRNQLEDRLTAEQATGNNADEIPETWIDLSQVYVPFRDGAVPYEHYKDIAYEVVLRDVHTAEPPTSVVGVYMKVVARRHFQGLFHLSAVAIVVSVVLLYFLGRFVTARVGRWVVHKFETAILARLPVISIVYSSVKQVTDFLFSERTVEYNRVVAMEYPRRGIWSIGFVTGESMLEITAAAGEPLVSVLVPTSPMPMTGYTMSVPRSEIIDLDLTIDQAFQFCVSCGVLVPDQQKVTPELLQQELAKRLVGKVGEAQHPAERRIPAAGNAVEETETGETEADSSDNSEAKP